MKMCAGLLISADVQAGLRRAVGRVRSRALRKQVLGVSLDLDEAQSLGCCKDYVQLQLQPTQPAASLQWTAVEEVGTGGATKPLQTDANLLVNGLVGTVVAAELRPGAEDEDGGFRSAVPADKVRYVIVDFPSYKGPPIWFGFN